MSPSIGYSIDVLLKYALRRLARFTIFLIVAF
uniref:Uncharacterized protein n=1 Tax=Parascaris equorum TaxID=6256 RepID=A0A914RMM7_PAREQ